MLSARVVYAASASGLTCFLVEFIYCFSKKAQAAEQLGKANEQFQSFRRAFLAVYWLAFAADALQGPYVYKLYEQYGLSSADNALLFVVGYCSSATFGTFVGSISDRLGRRNVAMVYCLVYIMGCVMKHMNSFAWLLVGRIMGGVATSLLYSVFDSWVVSEHSARGFDAKYLSGLFSAGIAGNSMFAITAGFVSEVLVDRNPMTRVAGHFHVAGPLMPFDLAMAVLLVCLALIALLWTENRSPGSGASFGCSFAMGVRALARDRAVLVLGAVVSCFEASMFIFIFVWTPALEDPASTAQLSCGAVFAAFMVMCALGSQIHGRLDSAGFSAERIGQGTLALSCASLAVPALAAGASLRFLAFLAFELCVGMYFPAVGTLKSRIVPEECRSSVYNLYRLPMNAIVVVTLISNPPVERALAFAALLLFAATLLQSWLLRRGEDRSSGREAGPGYLAVGASEEERMKPTKFGAAEELVELSPRNLEAAQFYIDVEAADGTIVQPTKLGAAVEVEPAVGRASSREPDSEPDVQPVDDDSTPPALGHSRKAGV